MVENAAGCLAVVLEQENVPEPNIAPQVEHAITEGPKDVFHSLCRHFGQRLSVVGCLDQHLVCPNARHLVVDAIGFAPGGAFHTQHWKLTGNYSRSPTGFVRAATRAISEDLRWRA